MVQLGRVRSLKKVHLLSHFQRVLRSFTSLNIEGTMRKPGFASLTLLAVAILGCEQDRPLLVESDHERPVSQATKDSEAELVLRVEPRFSVQLAAEGSMKPGDPITVRMVVESIHDTPIARYSIHLPEVEGARRSEFGPAFRVPIGEGVPALALERMSSPRGTRHTIVRTFSIPSPGYYRLAGGAFNESTDRDPWDGPIISTGNHETVWLWISKEGGQVTHSFDPSVFPENALIAPGPLRFLEPIERPGSPRLSGLSLASTVTVQLLYWDEGRGDWFAIENADWKITWTDYSDPYNPEVKEAFGDASNTGTFDPGCPDMIVSTAVISTPLPHTRLLHTLAVLQQTLAISTLLTAIVMKRPQSKHMPQMLIKPV